MDCDDCCASGAVFLQLGAVPTRYAYMSFFDLDLGILLVVVKTDGDFSIRWETEASSSTT